MKKILSAAYDSNEAKIVEVETTFTNSLPAFTIVGLATSDIQESRDRVKSALSTNKFIFPPKKITVNLAPSDLASKKGTHFDLPIALSIILQNTDITFDDYYIFGELGLDGRLKNSSLIFPIILSLVKKFDIKNIVVPKESVESLSKIPNLTIFGVSTIKEAVTLFTDDKERFRAKRTTIQSKYIELQNQPYYYHENFALDFFDVHGQEVAKRASLIAAAGNHNILYEGSPGSGKSMCAKRLQYIMPPKSLHEILDFAKNEMLEMQTPTFQPISPFRSPHNSSSKVSIFGGGSGSAKIGEISLSHNGILFFDEFPHFGKSTLEALREPLEDYTVLISRVNTKVRYDAKFLFVAAQNPCPCGNLFSTKKVCRCNDIELKRYKNKISEPLLDRIDLYVAMQESDKDDKPSITSKEMFGKVLDAFIMQKNRLQENLNGKISEEEINRHCKLDAPSQTLLHQAIDRFSLSHRGKNKVLKVARTIADIEKSKDIQKKHLLEALSYRQR